MRYRTRGFLGLLLVGGCALGGVHAAEPPPRMPELPALTTIPGAKRLPGKFVWADLVTDNLPAALGFYAGLFGWEFQSVHAAYAIALNEERPLAGIVVRPRPKDRPAQPRWFAYVSVSNVGRALDAVAKGGGRIIAPAEKLPRRGEQAVFTDAEGAMCGLIRSSSGDPEDFLAAPGDWIWIQLLSRDGRAAAEFYRRLADYEIVENSTPGRLSDYVLTSDGFARATVRTIPEGTRDVNPTWLLFVRVASVVTTVGRARELGGRVLLEPKPEFLEGRVAVVADPTGAAIGLLEWSEGMTKGAK